MDVNRQQAAPERSSDRDSMVSGIRAKLYATDARYELNVGLFARADEHQDAKGTTTGLLYMLVGCVVGVVLTLLLLAILQRRSSE